MEVKNGSTWLCTEEDYEYYNQKCTIVDADNNPDYNGDNDIEVK